MKKRVMTLIGGIVGTVFDAIYSIIMLIGLTAILDLLGGAEGSALIAVVSIIIIALGVVALILNAISISGFACNAEKYAKKRGLIITAIVFNFLLALLLLISLSSGVEVFTILVAIASIATAVLFIVDLCLEKRRVAQANEAKEETEVKEEA